IVVVKKGKTYYLVDGHHRAFASLKIGKSLLDAYIVEVPEGVELGLERLVRRRGIRSLRDIRVSEDGKLIEIKLRHDTQ
ncbi:MAG: hypothetical protein DRP01_06915, partial [Archaeoglobales archaeon]